MMPILGVVRAQDLKTAVKKRLLRAWQPSFRKYSFKRRPLSTAYASDRYRDSCENRAVLRGALLWAGEGYCTFYD